MNHSQRLTIWCRIGLPIVAGVFCGACATTTPQADASALRARAALTSLQASPLAARAPTTTAEAEQAVRVAETPQSAEEAAHLGYLAERKVEIAQNQASQRISEEQLMALSEERDRMQVAYGARQKQAEFARMEWDVRRPGDSQRAFFLPANTMPAAAASARAPVMTANTRYYCITSNNRYYCLTN